MKQQHSFAVMRGDRRQNLLCELLLADGYPAQLLPPQEQWEQVNLPPPGSFLVTAKADDELRCAAEDNGFLLLEYGKHPFFQAENGAITAENALQIAMKQRLRTLRGSDCMVIGWGNIGKPLAHALMGLGARVTVCVRREAQLCEIREMGYRFAHSSRLEESAADQDIIFNTAPELLLTEPVLNRLRPGVLVLDLASKPGGVDRESAQALGIKTVQALALPGKITPVSAAVAIQKTVYLLCEEVRG